MSPRARRRSLIGAGATLLVSFLAVGVFNAVYTAHAVQESDRKLRAVIVESDRRLCGVIAVSLTPRPEPPSNPTAQPSSEYGRDLQAYTEQQAAISAAGIREMRRLSDSIGCPR